MLPSKLDTKWAVTPSKNKPLKLVNLWCIPSAQVPVQESMQGPVSWSEMYLVIHLAHIASHGNWLLSKLSWNVTTSLCNSLPGGDSLFKLFLFCWADPSKTWHNPNFGCGLLWPYHREMWKEPFWWWFWLILWDVLDIPCTSVVINCPLIGKPVPASHLAFTSSQLCESVSLPSVSLALILVFHVSKAQQLHISHHQTWLSCSLYQRLVSLRGKVVALPAVWSQ